MASIIAQEVLSEIRMIARSDFPLPERRAEAAKRIDQFKGDLAAVCHQPGVPEKQVESVRRTLQRAAARHDLTAEENSVYAEALDVLMGQALRTKESPAGAAIELREITRGARRNAPGMANEGREHSEFRQRAAAAQHRAASRRYFG